MCKIIDKFLVIAFVMGLAVAFSGCSVKSIKGNGNWVTNEKEVSFFDKISFSCQAEVRYHVSDECRVVVTVDENLDEYLEFSTANNELNIQTKRGNNYSFTKCEIEIYAPLLTGVSISGAGRFVSEDIINSPTFTSKISGIGVIKCAFDCDHFIADISGAGDMSITGTAEDARIKISGAGNFKGAEFKLDDATVSISGSGNATIHAENNLNVNISGVGNVNYHGDPKTNINKSGLGHVKKID